MKLTPEAAAALDRLRRYKGGEAGQSVWSEEIAVGYGDTHSFKDMLDVVVSLFHRDCQSVADEMLRLVPPGHADEITPERLIACGFRVDDDWIRRGALSVYRQSDWWYVSREAIPSGLKPTNMGEVWNLMSKCGIEVQH